MDVLYWNWNERLFNKVQLQAPNSLEFQACLLTLDLPFWANDIAEPLQSICSRCSIEANFSTIAAPPYMARAHSIQCAK